MAGAHETNEWNEWNGWNKARGSNATISLAAKWHKEGRRVWNSDAEP